MEKFFKHWKKGWKVWLMMACINFLYAILFFGLGKIMGANKRLYYFSATAIGIIFVPTVASIIFKLFYRTQVVD